MDATAFEWPAVLARLIAGTDLSRDEASAVLREVMAGRAEDAQVAALLVALRAKGEAADEVAGFVEAMVDAAGSIDIDDALRSRLVDIVGTGGDAAGTFNISTLAAVVVAAAGVPVAKHGNRAASSQCGSADLLEAWGIALDLDPNAVAASIEEIGIGFLFARTFHPAMRIVGPIRQQLGVPTAFNILGPLSNPAHAPNQAVGVADERLAPIMAQALAQLGKRALVFRGSDGLDELTTTGPSQAWDVRQGVVAPYTIDPAVLGLPSATAADLRGGDVATNVAIADSILAGEEGPRADIVVLNAAAGLVVGGVADSLEEGIAQARDVLASGAARNLKEQWVRRTRELADR